jgi:DNA (cytosine-5)-methyltransferase 1
LSWRECARIQGLPDRIEPSGSLLDKYRVVGNAVPPRLGEILLKPIVEYERNLQQIQTLSQEV